MYCNCHLLCDARGIQFCHVGLGGLKRNAFVFRHTVFNILSVLASDIIITWAEQSLCPIYLVDVLLKFFNANLLLAFILFLRLRKHILLNETV